MNRSRLRKGLLLSAGIVCVALGAVGVFLPLLPTTPFLLLAAACFIRSSDRLYRWLMTHRLFGAYIRHYREYRAISLPAKIGTLALLWATIGYAILAVAQSFALRALLFLIAAGVTAHILSLRTLTQEMLAEDARRQAGDRMAEATPDVEATGV